MARPPISDSVQFEIKSWRAAGLTIDAIEDAMLKARNEGLVKTEMPGRGSIAKYSKQYDSLPQEQKNLDVPFEWHSLKNCGLPWEASSFLMPMWRWVSESGPFPTKGFDFPKPCVREVQWWWRVHLVDLELDYSWVWTIAQWFVVRELIHDVLGQPLELADLEAYLAYGPWQPGNLADYKQAIEAGRIPAIKPVQWGWPGDYPDLETDFPVTEGTQFSRVIAFITAGNPDTLFPEVEDEL